MKFYNLLKKDVVGKVCLCYTYIIGYVRVLQSSFTSAHVNSVTYLCTFQFVGLTSKCLWFPYADMHVFGLKPMAEPLQLVRFDITINYFILEIVSLWYGGIDASLLEIFFSK